VTLDVLQTPLLEVKPATTNIYTAVPYMSFQSFNWTYIVSVNN